MKLSAVTRSLACALAFSAFGCSDPPPRPASIGFYVTFQNPNIETGGRRCPTTAITYEIGQPAPLQSNPGRRLEDGTAGASISCTIKGKGEGPYKITAEGGGRSTSMGASMGKQLNILDLEGSVTNVAGAVNQLTAFGLFTPDTGGMSVGQPSGLGPEGRTCTVTKIHQVGAGLIHAEFGCVALYGGDETEACSATGTFVFEYCQVE